MVLLKFSRLTCLVGVGTEVLSSAGRLKSSYEGFPALPGQRCFQQVLVLPWYLLTCCLPFFWPHSCPQSDSAMPLAVPSLGSSCMPHRHLSLRMLLTQIRQKSSFWMALQGVLCSKMLVANWASTHRFSIHQKTTPSRVCLQTVVPQCLLMPITLLVNNTQRETGKEAGRRAASCLYKSPDFFCWIALLGAGSRFTE